VSTLYFLHGTEYNDNMFRIWAKVIADGKITKQLTYERDEKFTYSQFFSYFKRYHKKMILLTELKWLT